MFDILFVTYKTSRQKIKKVIKKVENCIKKLDPIETYKTVPPNRAEYTIFSSAYGTLNKIEPTVVYDTSDNLGLKSYRVCSLIIMNLNQKSIKIHLKNIQI